MEGFLCYLNLPFFTKLGTLLFRYNRLLSSASGNASCFSAPETGPAAFHLNPITPPSFQKNKQRPPDIYLLPQPFLYVRQLSTQPSSRMREGMEVWRHAHGNVKIEFGNTHLVTSNFRSPRSFAPASSA